MPCLKHLLAVIAFVAPATLFAQTTNCAQRQVVVEKLAAGYGEAFAGGGLQNAQQIFEVWYSEEKGTWTILMTRADGLSCIMAAGTNWRHGEHGVQPPKGIPG